jgi:hypothetical protein
MIWKICRKPHASYTWRLCWLQRQERLSSWWTKCDVSCLTVCLMSHPSSSDILRGISYFCLTQTLSSTHVSEIKFWRDKQWNSLPWFLHRERHHEENDHDHEQEEVIMTIMIEQQIRLLYASLMFISWDENKFLPEKFALSSGHVDDWSLVLSVYLSFLLVFW